MKYQNKQNGKVTKSVEFDEKTRCYDISFEDGSNTRISGSTFKRWYKKLEEEEVQEQKLVPMPGAEKLAELKQEVTADEDTCADGRTYAEIGKEIAEQAKQKAKNVKARKSSSISYEERLSKVTDVLSVKGYTVRVQDKQPSTLNIKSAGESKATYGIYLGGRKAVLLMPVTKVPKGATPDRVRNCPLGAAFDISYDNLEKINELI